VEAASLTEPFSAIALALQQAAIGRATTISWQEIFSQHRASPRELRRFLLLRPVLDYTDLQPGARASAAVRAAVAALGLDTEPGVRVRLTGPVALADDELASVQEGAVASLSLSLVLVIGFLFLALRSVRLILVVLGTLAAGLIWTAAFAALAIGTLNVISIAFAVMFLGIAVDFTIQFTVRFRGEHHRVDDQAEALRSTAAALGKPLMLASLATALGFLSFAPTDYRGVSELGVIAAAGMIIAAFLTFTLLPALLVLVQPAAEPEAVGFRWAAGIDRFLLQHRRSVLLTAAALALLCAGTLPLVRFDFNPLHLRDRQSESVATLLDLTHDPDTTPYTLDALAPSPKAAAELAAKLAVLREVAEVRTLTSFIPEDQTKKLAIIADLGFFLTPALNPVRSLPPPSAGETRAAAQATLAELNTAIAKLGPGEGRGTLAEALQGVAQADDAALQKLNQALLPGLTVVLGQLREALDAGPIDENSIPPELRRNWVAADGETRVEIAPRGDVEDNATLVAFTRAVARVAPDFSGTPFTIQESGATVARAFAVAGVSAIATIGLVLLLALRRLSDVALVLAPLALAALLTMASAVVVGLPLNFANVIALPLMLGVGVAFDIYFVTGWRDGASSLLQSPTARAILFSALTTTGAFGTLALSHHRGTAQMGLLLVMALGYALLTTLLFLPALLGPPPAASPGNPR
jgi:uncharacterized protein